MVLWPIRVHVLFELFYKILYFEYLDSFLTVIFLFGSEGFSVCLNQVWVISVHSSILTNISNEIL